MYFFQNLLPPLFFKTNWKWARCDKNVVFINENYCMLHTSPKFTYNPIPWKYFFLEMNSRICVMYMKSKSLYHTVSLLLIPLYLKYKTVARHKRCSSRPKGCYRKCPGLGMRRKKRSIKVAFLSSAEPYDTGDPQITRFHLVWSLV